MILPLSRLPGTPLTQPDCAQGHLVGAAPRYSRQHLQSRVDTLPGFKLASLGARRSSAQTTGPAGAAVTAFGTPQGPLFLSAGTFFTSPVG